MKKIIVIAGPTASGKTSLGVKMSKENKGEIVSADSRQIYEYMDIGTGKDIKKDALFKKNDKDLQKKIKNKVGQDIKIGTYNIEGVNIWGLDLIKPDKSFSVTQWVEFAKLAVDKILCQDKIPLLVGGTGFWIKALLQGIEWGKIPPDWGLRKKLGKNSIKKLQEMIKNYPDEFWQGMNKSDWNNPRRLIRRIEIAKYLKKNPKKEVSLVPLDAKISKEIILKDLPLKELKKSIKIRVKKRLEQGLIKEIKSLLNKGYEWSDPGMNTLGYKEFEPYFKEKKHLKECIEAWTNDEIDYARRQKVWFDKYF